MDAERFEIIKKLLEAHIKSLKDSIDFYREEKAKHPADEIIKRVVAGDVQAYYAYRTVLEWMISDAALRWSAIIWLNEK